MNKEHIVKENISFQRIISNNKAFKYKDYIIYVEKNNEKTYKFGFSVGKKIGKAVIRNKIAHGDYYIDGDDMVFLKENDEIRINFFKFISFYWCIIFFICSRISNDILILYQK